MRNQCIRVLRDATQLWYTFHNSHSILVVVFSSCCGNSSLFRAFCLVVHQPYDAGTNTYPRFCILFPLCKIYTLEDANIHKAVACKYSSKNICTVVEEWHHDHFCLRYFFSWTHFDLVRRMARKVWLQCVLVFGHDLGLRGGNCNGLLSNTGFFSFRAWRQIFATEVSDLDSSSPLSSIFDNWASISSDESISMSYNSNTVLSRAESRILNLYRQLYKISSEGIFDIDSKTSSHLVSNEFLNIIITKSDKEQNHHNSTLCNERQSLERSRRS